MAFVKVALLAALAAVALADDAPAPLYRAAPLPSYGPAPLYVEPAYPDVAPNYEYRYAVQDGYSYSDFEANEARNGYDTRGGYRVNLPDGRVQIVTYIANADGYTADVRYEGEAKYPEDVRPAYAAPVPAYAPAY